MLTAVKSTENLTQENSKQTFKIYQKLNIIHHHSYNMHYHGVESTGSLALTLQMSHTHPFKKGGTMRSVSKELLGTIVKQLLTASEIHTSQL